MPLITILVASTRKDILAEVIATSVRSRSDVALNPDLVVPVDELPSRLRGQGVRPDIVILVGMTGELDDQSNKLLTEYPSIVVARMIIGSEWVHMGVRYTCLQDLITALCNLFRRRDADQEQEQPLPDQEEFAEPIAQGRSALDQALLWLNAVLRLHLKRTAGPGNDLPGLSLSRTTIENLLVDPRADSGREIEAAAQCAVTPADDELMKMLEDADPRRDPLACLWRRFGLTPLETRAFVLCLAPQLSTRYQCVYGFLNDDLGRRNASLGLVASILGGTLSIRRALGELKRLLRWHLVATDGTLPPDADDPLRVDPTLVAWILGDQTALLRDPHLAGITFPQPWMGASWLDHADRRHAKVLKELLSHDRRQFRWVALAGAEGSVWRAILERAAKEPAKPLLRIGLSSLDTSDSEAIDQRLVRIAWAARLMGSIPVVDASADATSAKAMVHTLRRLVDTFSDLTQPCVLIVPDLAQAIDALPAHEHRVLLRDASASSPPVAAFASATREAGLQLTDADIERLAAAYPLPLDALDRAVRLAVARGAAAGQPESEQATLLAEACRVVACPELPRFATTLEPSFELDEVVLPAARRGQLDDIVAHVLHARTVLDSWGFAAQLPYGKGVAALFTGPSGTGKTMAARAIGRALDRHVFSVDLSRVVSKYIGETEKNLDTVFADAERAGAILLFDEADALFGKRSDVKDAHDRYANIETAYLLQRMEVFGGLAILTTNFGQNLDRAFMRRLRFVVEFPMPDIAARERIWRQCLPSQAPLSDDIDFRFLSRRVEITGGNIRQITLCAAFAAAAECAPIGMRHILQATRAEVLKLGMPGLERELAEQAA